MSTHAPATDLPHGLDAHALAFYRRGLEVARWSGVPYLVGGAYAFARYTGIERHTKDLDLFVREAEARQILSAFEAAGFRVERTFPHWLGKAFQADGDLFIDVIYSSGNSVCPVDDAWFEHGAAGEVVGVPVVLIPPEEMLWQKAYIMERERFDGADVAHLIRAWGPVMNWRRILERFGTHWRVLLGHVVLFGFIYPGERARIPAWVTDELLLRLKREQIAPSPPDDHAPLCQGTLLSRSQYLDDTRRRGYRDVRLEPDIGMSDEDVAYWTEAAFRR